MDLLRQWRRTESSLPPDWDEARLALAVRDEARRPRAAALLAPLAPGRAGDELRFSALRGPAAPGRAGGSPGTVARALGRLDQEGIAGELRLVAVDEAPAAEAPAREPTAADSWDAELARLPSDWSDAWVEVRFPSSDLVEPAALLGSPLNPTRMPDGLGFRFRAARVAGYGAPPELVRRCLARLDEHGIPALVHVLRALSDTRHVATQGPVWYVGGKVV